MATGAPVLTWLHIGDLHRTRAGEPDEPNVRAIAALASALPHGAVDVVRLPGDTADDGTPAHYQPARDILAGVSLPWHAGGSDRDAVGAWPETAILGTRFGPNRNGRTW